jgi:hypothetical protein
MPHIFYQTYRAFVMMKMNKFLVRQDSTGPRPRILSVVTTEALSVYMCGSRECRPESATPLASRVRAAPYNQWEFKGVDGVRKERPFIGQHMEIMPWDGGMGQLVLAYITCMAHAPPGLYTDATRAHTRKHLYMFLVSEPQPLFLQPS